MGRGTLAGRDMNFEQNYGRIAQKLWFEYLFFLQHIDRGYRVDLCAWDWDRKFAGLSSGRALTTNVKAGRGWQPTGLTVAPDRKYRYAAAGSWRIASRLQAVDANGDDRKRGRLVGALMKNFQLGDEFDLGDRGSLSVAAGGDLYLRCRSDWRELKNDSGQITVTFECGMNLQSEANAPIAAAARVKAGKTD